MQPSKDLVVLGVMVVVTLLGVCAWWIWIDDIRNAAVRRVPDEWQRLARTLRIGLVLCVILPALVWYAVLATPWVLLVWTHLAPPP